MVIDSSSKSNDRAVVHTQIEVDIEILHHTILRLKTRYNAVTLAAQLPDELLARIFEWNKFMQRRRDDRGWLQVTAVCTWWRRVAIACPRLWSLITHWNVEWLREVMLPRSGDIPLHIDVDLKRRKFMDGLRLVLNESHRIERFTIRSTSPSMSAALPQLLGEMTTEVPLMKMFQISISGHSESHLLPDNLFNGTAPNLRILRLAGFMIPPTSSFLPALTTLSLDQLHPEVRLTVPQLADLLRLATNLETLQLADDCCDISEYTPDPNFRRVQLLRLKSLSMSGHIKACTILLTLIDDPVTTYIELFSRADEGDNSKRLVQEVTARIHSIKGITVTNCPLQFAAHVSGSRSGTQEDFEFYVMSKKYCTLKEIFSTAPLLCARKLRIQCHLSKDIFFEMFGDMPRLTTIEVNTDADSFLPLLSFAHFHRARGLPTYVNIASSKTPSPFADLIYLSLTFGKPQTSILETSLLVSILQDRTAQGLPLKRLRVRGHIHSSPDVEGELAQLRELVNVVDWDVKQISQFGTYVD
ncbi:hypothetical protein H0H87_000374 [Tephrocybe sp. NHM501043]|nr:hypothetical protein H0H87_000374 [Tephrocybe sp. NHM501043]